MRSAFRITLVYLTVASLWILLSDKAISRFASDVGALTTYSSIKGLFYVSVTSLMLFLMIRKELSARNRVIAELNRTLEVKGELIRELHHRISNNIQVLLGVLGLETRKGDFSAESRDRIIHRLLSMRSVYDVVYDYEDMKEISLRNVLAEYERVSSRGVLIQEPFAEIVLPVESLVTLLLVLDIALEAVRGSGYDDVAVISAPEAGVLEIRLPGYRGDPGSFLGEDEAFVRIYLQSIQGDVRLIPGDPAVIRMLYR